MTPRRAASADALHALERRLAEAEQTLEAIRAGEVDSLVVEGPGGLRVYTLESAANTYRVMIEAISEGAATLTEDGLILYCNERLARMLGRPLQKVMGAPLRDLVAERSRPGVDALLHSALEAESRAELTMVAAGGQEVPAYLSVSCIEDEGRRVLCLIATDLREQKKSEEILAAEKLARSVLEQAAEAIVVCDGQGTIIRASGAAAELCGCNPLLRPFDEVFPIPASGESVAAAALRGRVLRAVPATLARPGGAPAEVQVSATPLSGAGGGVIGCVVTLVDVTQSRRAEEALRQAVTLRDQFLSVAAHELRTPITALSLQLEGLERLLVKEAGGDERALKKARSAIRQVDRLGMLVEGLLNVSRIVSGHFELQLEQFDLGEVVKEMLDRMSDLAARSGCELRLSPDSSAVGTWDRSRLEQVVTNLVTNAIKYGAGRPIDVSVEQAEGSVELRVRDRGIGISPADQQRIFDRFERAAPASHYGGLGLGLYISREIALAHGGSIQVTSEPGQGATFRVRLPLAARPWRRGAA
ncbi:MAG TPA: ATP-binding protein [Myxococcaceae bacterium]|nr:ATP-binding protein [Myxococcaceae bacterium]